MIMRKGGNLHGTDVSGGCSQMGGCSEDLPGILTPKRAFVNSEPQKLAITSNLAIQMAH